MTEGIYGNSALQKRSCADTFNKGPMRLFIFTFHILLTTLAASFPSHAKDTNRAPTHLKKPVPPTPEQLPPKGSQRTPPTATATAEEYLAQASKALAQQNWEEAAAAYHGFIRDFTRPETEPVIAKFQPALAACLLKSERYEEALTVLHKAISCTPPFPSRVQTELLFQCAVCEWQLKHYPLARAHLTQLTGQFISGERLQQSLLRIAQCHLLESNPAAAAEHLAQNRQKLNSTYAPKALLLHIQALLEAGTPEQAFSLATTEGDSLERSFEAIAFQNTLLKLGTALNADGHFRQAIRCLKKIRPSHQLLEFGETQEAWLQDRAVSLPNNIDVEKNKGTPELSERLRLDLKDLKQCPNFDARVSVELARAYQSLQRYRESALVLSHALQTQPPDALLEESGVSLVQNWFSLECWTEVERASSLFLEKYPRSAHGTLVRFITGMAQQRENRFEDAVNTFTTVARDLTNHDLATRSRFMVAFTELLAGEPVKAAAHFTELIQEKVRHEIVDDASAWLSVSHAISKDYPMCRTTATAYLRQHPDGANLSLVLFQNARAAFALREYHTAIPELSALLKRFPEHPRTGEIQLMLADAYWSTQESELSLSTLNSVPTADTASFEEAWFKAAKLLKHLEKHDLLEPHLARFAEARPESSRYSDAVLWTAKVLQEKGRHEDAQRLVWRTIDVHLDSPHIPAVEALLSAAPTAVHGDQPLSERIEKIRSWSEETLRQKHGRENPTAAVRAQWALACALRGTQPLEARRLLIAIYPQTRPNQTSDRILADVADACSEHFSPQESATIWRDLLKWHPRSIFKDRALSAGITAAEKAGERDKTLALIQRMALECADSPLLSRALLTKATLQESANQWTEAKETLDALLSERQASGQLKSEALLRLGEHEMQQRNPKAAIAYYQRIYVLYARWKPQLAKAYLRSAEAFEQLEDHDAARQTYLEMLQADIPSDCAEKTQAQTKLAQMNLLP